MRSSSPHEENRNYTSGARYLTLFLFLCSKDIVRHPHNGTTRWNADFVPVECLGTASAVRCGPVM